MKNDDDPNLGLVIEQYRLARRLGSGKIGVVYLAEHTSLPQHRRACKIIQEGDLRAGWERELEKVAVLDGVPGVVRIIHWDSTQNNDHRPIHFIFYEYIPGKNLKDYSDEGPLPIPEIENIARTLLSVLHACKSRDIVHGDIHEGNILLSEPDDRIPGAPRRFFVSDFGYGGSHNEITPKDDSKQIAAIVQRLLAKLTESDLSARDRIVRERITSFFKKEFLESYGVPTVSLVPSTLFAATTSSLTFYERLQTIVQEAEREAAAARAGFRVTAADDYLFAEALGHRTDEWQNLFVPEFLGSDALLSRNVTVITGARGCGKTMTFRRLTIFLDELIGTGSGVPGADQILGFYLNCRDLVEAFPYIGKRLNANARSQVTHFFHLSWLAEILRALGLRNRREPLDYRWMISWLNQSFDSKSLRYVAEGVDALSYLSSFVESEKERCRISPLGRKGGWPLGAVDFLDRFQAALAPRVPWIGDRPIHCFLDDYTIPLLAEELQDTLNPIVFKRRAGVFFKVSTEASNSFKRIVGQKQIEINHDYELIDLGNETLYVDEARRTSLLDGIMRRRIDRAEEFTGRGLGLDDVIGKNDTAFNEMARMLREKSPATRQSFYWGTRTFVGAWSSDIRSSIQLFSEILRDYRSRKLNILPIDPTIQHKRFIDSGGEFLALTESVSSPSYWQDHLPSKTSLNHFGKKLRSIAQAFLSVSRYELMEGALIDNQGNLVPKQAFRIEIVDDLSMSDRLLPYFHGLIRWHVFLQDWRGRSVRGVLTPRLFLNRRIIPYARLTFSSHDSIQMSNSEFNQLLENPTKFPAYWRKKRKNQGGRPGPANPDSDLLI